MELQKGGLKEMQMVLRWGYPMAVTRDPTRGCQWGVDWEHSLVLRMDGRTAQWMANQSVKLWEACWDLMWAQRKQWSWD
jgi:hypothetical protein